MTPIFAEQYQTLKTRSRGDVRPDRAGAERNPGLDPVACRGLAVGSGGLPARPHAIRLPILAIIFIFLAGFVGQAFADDIPARKQYSVATVSGWFFDGQEMCSLFQAGSGRNWIFNESIPACQWNGNDQPVNLSWYCPSGSSRVTVGDVQVCRFPTSCPEPQVRNQITGACEAPPPPDCEPGCNGACGQQKVYNRLRTLTCIDLCIYRLGGGMEIELSNGQSRAFMTVQENTGQACTPAEEEPTTPDPQPCPECACQEQGKSYVVMAGVATCVEPGTPGSEPVKKQDPPKIETTTPAPTPENPNPEPVETVTPSPIITITPAPAGSPPGTGPTVTETTTNPDGSTTSTAQGQDKFCQANPTHALCKADEAKRFCEENPDVLACQKLGEPGEGEAIGEKTIDLGFSPVDVPGSTGGSCPAPVTISIGGRSASLSWDWLCQYANGIKPAVLAVAWLSAALIVFGAVRERD